MIIHSSLFAGQGCPSSYSGVLPRYPTERIKKEGAGTTKHEVSLRDHLFYSFLYLLI